MLRIEYQVGKRINEQYDVLRAMFNLASQEAHPAALETLILYMPLSADLTLLTVSVWKPSESNFMSYRNDGSTGTSLWNLEKITGIL